MWAAKWGLIDDHDIFATIGRGYRLDPSRFWEQLKVTEVFKFGEYARYRPTYYVFRLFESMLWGKNPHVWYAFRLFATVISLVVLWRVLQKYCGFAISGLIVLYILSFQFWQDVVLRLGPGEFYALFGLAMFAWGADNLFRGSCQACRWNISVSAFFIGGLVCIGVKENLTLISAISLWLFLVAWRNGRATAGLIIATVIHLLYSAVVVASIYLATRSSGRDIYSHDVSLKARFMLVQTLLMRGDFLLVAGITAVICGAFFGLWRRHSSASKAIGLCVVLSLFCLGFYLANFVFYNGRWPTGMRYDYPGVCITPILVIVFVRMVQRLMPERCSAGAIPRIGYALAGLCILYMAISSLPALATHRSVALGNSLMTRQMTHRIEQIARRAQRHPSYPIVILATEIVGEYEFIFSYQRFLRGYGVKNPITIEYVAVPQTPVSLGEQLQSEVVSISQHGNEQFQPLAPEYGKCFLLKLSGQSRFQCKGI
jgi:hypothetical protein